MTSDLSLAGGRSSAGTRRRVGTPVPAGWCFPRVDPFQLSRLPQHAVARRSCDGTSRQTPLRRPVRVVCAEPRAVHRPAQRWTPGIRLRMLAVAPGRCVFELATAAPWPARTPAPCSHDADLQPRRSPLRRPRRRRRARQEPVLSLRGVRGSPASRPVGGAPRQASPRLALPRTAAWPSPRPPTAAPARSAPWASPSQGGR